MIDINDRGLFSLCKLKLYLPLDVLRKSSEWIQLATTTFQGPVSRKPRKLFGPAKPFLIVCILKTRKCIGMRLCMKGIFLHIINM